MIDNVLNLVFRCSHRRTSLPVTPVTQPGGIQADTYIVCLDCGKRFIYDLKKMRIGHAIAPPPPTKLLPPDPSANQGVFASIFGFGRGRSARH